LLLGHQPVCAVEIDTYRQQVLSARQKDGIFSWFPIFDDVREFDGTKWRGLVDVVCAGFPCQPFSVAGKQRGDDDERNMWPETIRIIREVGPGLCLLENVPGLVSSGYIGTVLGDLADAGYDAEWDIVSAADVGAPHLRKRLWILAYAAKERLEGAEPLNKETREQQPTFAGGGRSEAGEIPDAEIVGRTARRTESAARDGGAWLSHRT